MFACEARNSLADPVDDNSLEDGNQDKDLEGAGNVEEEAGNGEEEAGNVMVEEEDDYGYVVESESGRTRVVVKMTKRKMPLVERMGRNLGRWMTYKQKASMTCSQ